MGTLAALAAAAPVQAVQLPELAHAGVELSVWRLDLIDSAAPGNKRFKLEENLRAARRAGHRRILSFGGAFSNHIHALALAGAAAGFETVGVIRGEAGAACNPTLSDARRAGMMLHFVDRSWYRRRDSLEAHAELRANFGPCYIIPEGGANTQGALGCRVLGEVIRAWPQPPHVVALACGTGCTLAGLVAGLEGRCAALGLAVLKGGRFLEDAVRAQLRDLQAPTDGPWHIDPRHHGGGYARLSLELARFIEDFQRRTRIPLEPVYTGKLLYGLWRGISAGEFARGTRLLAVHSGGLQGARGFAGQYGANPGEGAAQAFPSPDLWSNGSR